MPHSKSIERVEFTVSGEARPKGSRTVGIRKDGSRFTRPAAKGEREWTQAVARAAFAAAQGRQLRPPYEVSAWFGMPTPTRPKYPWPSRIDCDKLLRNLSDGLVWGGVIVDDRHIVRYRTVEKLFADIPATRVIVQSLHGQSVQEEQGNLLRSLPAA